MLKIKDLTELLQISESTVRRWMKEGMPHVKVGNTLRFEAEAVTAWMKGRGQ